MPLLPEAERALTPMATGKTRILTLYIAVLCFRDTSLFFHGVLNTSKPCNSILIKHVANGLFVLGKHPLLPA